MLSQHLKFPRPFPLPGTGGALSLDLSWRVRGTRRQAGGSVTFEAHCNRSGLEQWLAQGLS